MLKILQARLQQYINRELPDVQVGFRKDRNKRSNCQHLLDHLKTKRVPEKHLFLFYSLCQSLWLCGSNNLWKILQEMGIPDHLTCLLRNLCAGQEATELDMEQQTGSKLGKEYIMRNAGLEEAQAGIKIAGRNIDNLRYADDITLMAESEEELNSLLMKVKEE